MSISCSFSFSSEDEWENSESSSEIPSLFLSGVSSFLRSLADVSLYLALPRVKSSAFPKGFFKVLLSDGKKLDFGVD